jgi:hypothetical protein
VRVRNKQSLASAAALLGFYHPYASATFALQRCKK